MRSDGRARDALRQVTILPDFVRTAYGSCLISFGMTRVICTASVEEKVPPFLEGRFSGWLTAEYAMLPASTGRRKERDGIKRDGRGVEISRLIGRSLRQAVDLQRLGKRTITIDCDVLEADGGTRTAAITGGYVALCLAIDRLIREGKLKESPVVTQIAGVSAGLFQGQPLLDLAYREDSAADADVNVVMTSNHELVELQGTGEGRAFSRTQLDELLTLAQSGIDQLMQMQREALDGRANVIAPQQTLVVASNNAHKIRELTHMLGNRYRVISMREAGVDTDIDETGDTFAENAVIKAEAV
ncbi:MAG: ribonuclease PH, partial [Clostridiales bacterium]|nr:ribonuclease PH [Clostridiales bacterium]